MASPTGHFSLFLVCLLMLVGACSVRSQFVDYGEWQAVLDQYLITQTTIDDIVDQSAFNYGGLRNYGSANMTNFLNQLSTSPYPTTLNKQFEVLINAYNALSVNMILENPCKAHLGKFCWPISSIRDISGYFVSVWDMSAGVIDNVTYTLNQIQGQARNLSDPRIHACLACAGASCPNLQPVAFYASQMESLKNYSMQQFLNNQQKGLYLDSGTATLYLSSIFQLYADDFSSFAFPTLNGGKPFGSVLNFVKAFAPVYVQEYLNEHQVTLAYFSFNWRLNTATSAQPHIPS